MGAVLSTINYSAGYIRWLLTHWDARDPEDSDGLLADVRRAVLIIPGFLGTRGALTVLRRRFIRAGLTPFTLNSGWRSIYTQSRLRQALFGKILRIKRRCPRLERLDLVGHSQGGIIALETIENGGLDGWCTRLVTLGAPFRGTWAGLLGGPLPGAVELLPLLRRSRLRRNGRRVPSAFLSIAGEYDLLAPPDRCRHPDASNLVLPVDHAGLVFKKDVFRAVHAFLAE